MGAGATPASVYERAFHHCRDGLVLVDRSGAVLSANRAMVGLLPGWPFDAGGHGYADFNGASSLHCDHKYLFAVLEADGETLINHLTNISRLHFTIHD